MSFGLFEAMDLDTSLQRTASRKALAIANRRAQDRFSSFLDVKPNERQARFGLIAPELQKLVIAACQEQGYDDPESVYYSVLEHLGQHVAAPRRPKMCPFHRELTDMALTLKDPKAAFETLAQHQFGDASCRGSHGGTCNWEPGMVNQEYWDARQEQADQRSQERMQAPQMQAPAPGMEDSFPDRTEAPEYNGPDIDNAIDAAPSAVGNPTPEMALASKQSWNFDKKDKDKDDGDEPDDDDPKKEDKEDEKEFNWDKDKEAKKKKEYQEGAVCSSCSSGTCSGCNGGSCGCGSCGGSGGGTTASMKTSIEGGPGAFTPGPGPFGASPHATMGTDNYEICQNCGSDHTSPDGSGRCMNCGNDPSVNLDDFSQQLGQGLMPGHQGAIPGAHDPNYFDPYGGQEEEGYGEEGGLDELIAALQLEYPGIPYEQLLQMAQQEAAQPQFTDVDQNADWGQPQQAYASVHEAIKGGDSIVEHMDFPAQNHGDDVTGLSKDSPVNIDRKTWQPSNMPKLDVDKPNGMHNTVQQDITQPTNYTGDAFNKDDGRFDSFKNPTEMQTLPVAGDDETRLGDSGFAGNNMDDPQSVSDVWTGTKDQTSPVTDGAGATVNGPMLSHFVPEAEILRALSAYKG